MTAWRGEAASTAGKPNFLFLGKRGSDHVALESRGENTELNLVKDPSKTPSPGFYPDIILSRRGYHFCWGETTLTVNNASSSSEGVIEVVHLPCPAVMHLLCPLGTFSCAPKGAGRETREQWSTKQEFAKSRGAWHASRRRKAAEYEIILSSRVQTRLQLRRMRATAPFFHTRASDALKVCVFSVRETSKKRYPKLHEYAHG